MGACFRHKTLNKTNQNLNWYRKHNYLQNSANIPKLFWKIAPKKKHSSKHTITHPPVISTAISDHLAEIGVQQVILDAAGAQEIIRRGNHLLPDVSRLRDMRRHGCVHRLHTHDEKAGAIHATFGAFQCIPNRLITLNRILRMWVILFHLILRVPIKKEFYQTETN